MEATVAYKVDLGDVDLRALRTSVQVEDDELVLKVGDDDATVTFAAGLNSHAQAILGAQRLASAANELAQALRDEVLNVR